MPHFFNEFMTFNQAGWTFATSLKSLVVGYFAYNTSHEVYTIGKTMSDPIARENIWDGVQKVITMEDTVTRNAIFAGVGLVLAIKAMRFFLRYIIRE